MESERIMSSKIITRLTDLEYLKKLEFELEDAIFENDDIKNGYRAISYTSLPELLKEVKEAIKKHEAGNL